MVFDISIWRIVAAVVVFFGIGALWYSPVLFARPWMKELGKKKSDLSDARSAMILTLAAMVVLVIVEAFLVRATGIQGAGQGAKLGFLLWLGFAAPTGLINNAFQGVSKKLLAIDQGYHLVGLVVAGLILAF